MSMNRKAFLAVTEAPAGLYGRVLERVAAARRFAARLEFAGLALASCCLTLLFVPAVSFAVSEFNASGFGTYLSLLFSDAAFALTSRDFLLSLVESLPSAAILILVALGASLGWSLMRAARRARIAFA